MKVKELKELLSGLQDNADVCVVNEEQDITWDILECRICEDKSSDFYGTFLDIVIESEV